jgi:hypothetical protein
MSAKKKMSNNKGTDVKSKLSKQQIYIDKLEDLYPHTNKIWQANADWSPHVVATADARARDRGRRQRMAIEMAASKSWEGSSGVV